MDESVSVITHSRRPGLTRRGAIARMVSLVIIACLGLILSGCQAGMSQEPGITHLTLWHGVNPPPNRDVLNRLVGQFNQTHPSIQVDALYIGQGDQQMPKILSAVVGDAPPSMLWYAPMITGQLVELDAIRPLDHWFAESSIAGEIDPTLLDSMTWDGHIWSVPFGINNVGIFYRPSLFDAAGITQLPSSWSDIRAIARQLTDNDEDTAPHHGILLPLGKGEWTVFIWLSFLWSAGGNLIDPNTGHPDLATPEAIAALEFWQNLVDDGSATLSQPERGYELDDFLAGRVAMQLTGPWTLRQLRETGVDFAVMPIPPKIQQATAVGGENLFIFKTSPDTEQAALTFAEYVLSEDFQTQWAIETGYLPVNLNARQSEPYQDFVEQQPAIRIFLNQAPHGRSRPILPGYNRLSEQLGRAIEAALLDRDTPQHALNAAQTRLDLIFEAYR
ncbi:MAG: ABC transporter substrate-binding protein [Elainellaceae cyanobacterium]